MSPSYDTTGVSPKAALWVIAATLLLAASLLLWRDHTLRTLLPQAGWAVYWNEPGGSGLVFTVDNGSPITQFRWQLSNEGQVIASDQAEVPAGTKAVIVPETSGAGLAEKFLLEITDASGAKRELYKIFP